MITLAEIESEVARLAEIIGAKGNVLPTFGTSEDFGRPHIEVDAHGLHFVVVERGRELERITTENLDELLYQVFEATTFELALNFEASHRIENQDCRRILFKKQIELLSMLSPNWAARESRDHDRILQEHPFVDSPK